MVTLTRSGAEIRWEDSDLADFEKFRGPSRVAMPVASSRVNRAVHRAVGGETHGGSKSNYNGAHRRRIRSIR